MGKTREIAHYCSVLFIAVLMGILLAGYYQEWIGGYHPCSLCFLQRFGLSAVAVGIFFALTQGAAPKYYAIAMVAALFGMAVSLHHIAINICDSFYGSKVLGFHLYTWAFLAFFCSLLAIGLLLFLPMQQTKYHPTAKQKKMIRAVFFLLLAVLALGVLSSYLHCGFWL